MFIRKLYYDLVSGVVLSSHMRQGSVRMTTFAEDVNTLPELAGRTEADTICMMWAEPDVALEEAFSKATGVTVDVGVNPHQIVFDYTPIVEEPDEMEKALNELGVVTRDGE